MEKLSSDDYQYTVTTESQDGRTINLVVLRQVSTGLTKEYRSVHGTPESLTAFMNTLTDSLCEQAVVVKAPKKKGKKDE